MFSKVADILICPKCNYKFKSIERYLCYVDAKLKCNACGRTYLVINDIPRFVVTDKYVDSFSIEWDKHKRTQLDSASGLTRAEDMFFERTGFSKDELKGKLILDAGCGIGRFSEIAQKYGCDVVGVDLSYSVEAAKQNVPDATIIQADILNLPFKKNSFDFVFSIGVIHHTSDTKAAFRRLAELVKPGGKLAVWVYSDDGWKFVIYNKISDFYRIFTTRMPKELLYKLSHIAIPMYYINRIPVLGMVTRALLPLSIEKNPEWRVLDTFDWYSPKYQTKHTYQELKNWFWGNGFVDITPLKVPVSMQGTKLP